MNDNGQSLNEIEAMNQDAIASFQAASRALIAKYKGIGVADHVAMAVALGAGAVLGDMPFDLGMVDAGADAYTEVLVLLDTARIAAVEVVEGESDLRLETPTA